MQVQSGTLKGRPIPFAKDPRTRPTSDKVRRAVFDALKDVLPGTTALDLYAGTGAMGIEALSQGAPEACFVEHDRAQSRRLAEALEGFRLAERYDVICQDALEALKLLARKGRTFGLVFVDPPYAGGLGARTMEALGASPVVTPGAFVVWECGKRERAPAAFGALENVRDRLYGDTRVVIYRRRAGE